MNCKFHPAAEAVTTCGWCEEPMCNECVGKSFITRKLNGRPTCYSCSKNLVEEDVAWLKRCKVALIISIITLIIVIASVYFYVIDINDISWIILLPGFFFARISTFENLDESGQEGIGKKIIAIIIFTIASPIAFIIYFIKYLKKKSQHKYDLQNLQEYKSIMSMN